MIVTPHPAPHRQAAKLRRAQLNGEALLGMGHGDYQQTLGIELLGDRIRCLMPQVHTANYVFEMVHPVCPGIVTDGSWSVGRWTAR